MEFYYLRQIMNILLLSKVKLMDFFVKIALITYYKLIQ